MKNIILLVVAMFFANSLLAQNSNKQVSKGKEKDIWSGYYRFEPMMKDTLKLSSTIYYRIKKVDNLKPENVPARFESDLDRWSMTSDRVKNHEDIVRRFLFNSEDEEDEYKEFGWSDLHVNGKMDCIHGGNFFICRTIPNSVVKLGKDEEFVSKTGIFGILLHYGIFYLYQEE